MKLLTASVGDENHEPHPEQIEQIKQQLEEATPEDHTVLTYPYHIDITNHEDTEASLTQEQIEEMQEKIIENTETKAEVKTQ